MKRILKKLTSGFSKLIISTSSLWKVFKDGGFAHHTVALIDHGNILQGKRILITGGSSGIGLSLAKKCVNQGAIVIITGRDSTKLSDALRQIKSPNAHSITWDIGDISIIGDRLLECKTILGCDIDILVNNAGIIGVADFFSVDEHTWDSVYKTNSKGLFFLTQAVCKNWKHHKQLNYKKIINISSQGGFVGATYPYRMTKWDIAGLTQGLGLKLAEDGIIVNGIAPGIISTNMQPQARKQKNNMFCSQNALKRFALPEEIAELGVFLMSDAANFIVGQTIVCDGGFSIK